MYAYMKHFTLNISSIPRGHHAEAGLRSRTGGCTALVILCTHCLLTFVPSVSLQEVFYKLEVGMSSERPDAQTEGIYVQPPGSREWRNLTDVAKVVSYFIMLTFDLCCDYLAYL